MKQACIFIVLIGGFLSCAMPDDSADVASSLSAPEFGAHYSLQTKSGSSVVRGVSTYPERTANARLETDGWDQQKKSYLAIDLRLDAMHWAFNLAFVTDTGEYVLGQPDSPKSAHRYVLGFNPDSTQVYFSTEGVIRVTKFSTEFHKLSAEFRVRLVDTKSLNGDTVTLSGSVKDIDLAYLLPEKPVPTSRYGEFDMNCIAANVLSSHYSRSGDSLFLSAGNVWYLEQNETHTRWVYLMLRSPKLGTFTSAGPSMGYTIEHRIIDVYDRGRPRYEYWDTSTVSDTVIITAFDRERQTISGRYTHIGNRGEFDRLSWVTYK